MNGVYYKIKQALENCKENHILIAKDYNKNYSKSFFWYPINKLEKLLKNNNNLYEVVLGQNVKLVFDLEYYEDKNCNLNNFLKHVEKCFYELFNETIVEPIIINGYIKEDGRKSYHLIYNNNKIFKNIYEAKRVFTYIMNTSNSLNYFLNGKTKFIADNCIYSNNKNFRLLNQSKFGSNRVLTVDNNIDVITTLYQYFGNDKDYYNTDNIKCLDKNRVHILRVIGNNNVDIYGLLKFDCKNKHKIEINDKKDYLFAIPNKDEYRQDYEIWMALGMASKRIGISKEDFKKWSNDEEIPDWDKWNVNSNGYGYNFVKKCARICSPIIDSLSINFFLNSDTPHIEYNERYVKGITLKTHPSYKPIPEIYNIIKRYENRDFVVNTKAVVIQSTLNTGKSTESKRLINLGWNSILIITPRITYAESVYYTYNKNCNIQFKSYKKNCNFKKDNYIICSMESLHLLHNRTFELVIMDEVEANLTQFGSHTMREFKKVQTVFKHILTSAKNILFLDGFVIPKRSIQLLKDLKIDYTYIRNNFKHTNMSVKEFECINSLNYINFIRNHLSNGKKIYAVITKKKLLHQIYDELHNSFKVKIYHRDISEKDKIIKDVNKDWINYDLVLTTTTITIGVDFTVEHFDFGMIYGSNFCGLARDVAQSIIRVRNYKYKMIYLTSGWIGYTNFSPTINQFENETKKKLEFIKTYIEEKVSNGSTISLMDNDRDYWKEMPIWLKNVYYANKYEEKLSFLYYKPMLLVFLKWIGFEIEGNYFPDSKLTIPKDQYLFEELPTLTFRDLIYLKNKEKQSGLTEYEKLIIRKKIILMAVKCDNYEYIFSNWNICKKKLYFLKYEELGEDKLYEVEKRFYIEKNNLDLRKLHSINKLKKILGEGELTDSKLLLIKDEIFNTEFEGFINKKYKVKNLKNTVNKINSIFNQWNFDKLVVKSKQRIQVNGVRKRVITYGLEQVIYIQQNNILDVLEEIKNM